MKNEDWEKHVAGSSTFVNDLPLLQDTLHAFVFTSPSAKGKIVNVDISKALSYSGIVKILSAKDIPGENELGITIKDEPLLADGEVHFIGQPVLIIIGKNDTCIREAARLISIEIAEEKPVLDPREAFRNNDLIAPPVVFECGDIELSWVHCKYIVEGTVNSSAQEHIYLETQTAYAVPGENGMKIYSSTQGPTAVQKVVSGILNIPMHKVEVDVLRLGGGFGGKEDQANTWAAIAALASFKTKRPVKISLLRHEDIRFTGKRHPYSSDYKLGLSTEGKIIAFEVFYYQNAGASADLSIPILERTLFHAANSYFIPNVKATAYSCRTNLPPNTAFRGFGGPQAMFVIESAIHKAASVIGVDARALQERNLLQEGNSFHYGQTALNCSAEAAWRQASDKFNFDQIYERIVKFNNLNKYIKRGVAVMPICFGISFTNKTLNQANALVHVYTDGSVGVSTGAVEMGQGVSMKLRQAAASVFGIGIEKIKIESTNTTRSANTSPTAASSGADLNGNALIKACNEIKNRLTDFVCGMPGFKYPEEVLFIDDYIVNKKNNTSIKWNELITKAYLSRINLSAHAHYAPEGINFDRSINKGSPFAYHVYGTAVIEAEVDCLRGTYKIISVRAVHDFGRSINPAIDCSQAEGALMQGIGWITLEEILYSEKGKIMADTLSGYKVPDLHYTPADIEIDFLANSFPSAALLNSKAVGEPPLMYGIGAFFAIANAVKAFNPDAVIKYDAPITPEKVLFSIYGEEI